MKDNIMFLDDEKRCEGLKEEYNLIYVTSLELLKKELENTKIDLLVYNSKFRINIHSIITILLDNNLNTVPILALGSKDDVDYDLIFGPFSDDSLEQVIELSLSYKKIFAENMILKEENSYLKEGILSEREDSMLNGIEKFNTMITQEFKRFKRLNKDISMIIVEAFCYDIKNYSSSYVEEVLKEMLSIIRESMREIDITLFYDTNKLLILMPDTNEEQLSTVNKRIINIRDDFNNNKSSLNLSFDLKVFKATSDSSISSFSQLVKKVLNSN